MNITLYPLGAYVSGYCLPFTIELDGMDQADYGQAISKGLFGANYKKGDGNVLSSRCQRCDHVVIGSVVKCCKECGGIFIEAKQTDEEWIVCDTEDVPSEFVGEYDLDIDFFDYARLQAESNLDKEVFSAGFACGFALHEIADRYVGSYSSDADFAEQLAEDTGSINTSLAWPYTCINWEWAAHDLMMDHDSFAGHYFFRS